MQFRVLAWCGLSFLFGLFVGNRPGGFSVKVQQAEPAQLHVKVKLEGESAPLLPFIRPRNVGECPCNPVCNCSPCSCRSGNYGVDVKRLEKEKANYGPGFVK